MTGLLIFVSGLLLGALSWAMSPLLTGHFEPFDSGPAMLAGQLMMSAFTAYIGFRQRLGKLMLALLGLHVGQLGYSYQFGSDETRAWIALGAIAILLLCTLPLLAGVGGILTRRLLDATNHNSR